MEAISHKDFMKQYHFVFQGHEYTLNDRAANQGRCPHCNAQSSDHFMFDADGDKECFIGYYKIDDDNCTLCFECPSCFRKFYYHMPINSIIHVKFQSSKQTMEK